MNRAAATTGLSAVLRPRTVAIVGDSPRPGSRGGAIHENLLKVGYPGTICPVNPGYDEIRGLRCYPALDAVPHPVDFVAVAVGADQADDVMRQAVGAGARAASFLAGGFAEAGVAGRAAQDRLRGTAESNGIALVGPNCYGIANLVDGFAAYFGSLPDPRPGPVAFVSQSGGVLNAVVDAASGRGIGFSHLVTTGNEASLRVDHYVSALAAEPGVRLVMCYLETVRDAAALDRAFGTAHRAGVPVLVLRAGRTDAGRVAVAAHTGAVATESRVLEAAFHSNGVVVADDVDELVNACELLVHGRGVPSRGTVLTSISGGTCALAADVADEVGVPLTAFDDGTSAELARRLPLATSPANPLDLTGGAATDDAVLPGVLDVLDPPSGGHDVVLLLNSPTGVDDADRALYRRLAHAFGAHPGGGHRAVVTTTSGAVDPDVAATAHRHGVPVLTGLRPALRALRLVADRAEPAPPTSHPSVSEWPSAPTEADVKQRLTAYGLTVPDARLVTSADDAVRAAAELGHPVVLKAQSPRLAHKTECGAVRVGLGSDDDVRAAYLEIDAGVRTYLGEPPTATLVERQAPAGVDVLVGVLVDAALGPFLVCGSGGVLAELLDDVVVERAPVTPDAARRMIGRTRLLAGQLHGVRGAPPADVDALVDVLCRVSDVAMSLSTRPCALDLNPVRVLARGHGAVVLDAWLAAGGDAP